MSDDSIQWRSDAVALARAAFNEDQVAGLWVIANYPTNALRAIIVAQAFLSALLVGIIVEGTGTDFNKIFDDLALRYGGGDSSHD